MDLLSRDSNESRGSWDSHVIKNPIETVEKMIIVGGAVCYEKACRHFILLSNYIKTES